MKFTNRFERKFNRQTSFGVLYFQNTNNMYSRELLPAGIALKGIIVWSVKEKKWHCTTGPAFISICGNVEYWLNGKQVSKMEAML